MLYSLGIQIFVLEVRVIPRTSAHLQFRVFKDFSFVISNHDFFVVVIEDIARVNWNFTPASWCIDDELGYSVAGSMTPETFDDLDPFCQGSREVSRAVNQIALVDVVRAHPAHHQLVD